MCRTERALLRRFSSLQFGLAMTFLQNHPLGNGLPSGLFQQVDRFIITTLRIPNTRTGPLPPLPPVPPPASPRGDADSKSAVEGDVDNLIDLLMKEALAPVNPEMRAHVQKISHGVYRVSVPSPTSNAPPVDTSSVARIAQISQQSSAAGAKTSTPGATQGVLPFGLGRPAPPVTPAKPDPQALISKRVEAATRAADVAKQVLRRQIDFQDEEKLRKLLIKGLKHDQQWSAAYQDQKETCSLRVMTEQVSAG
eukprot:g25876.t1